MGYIMALGGELDTITQMQKDLDLLENELKKVMSIIILVEGETEEIWIKHFREALQLKQRICQEHITQAKNRLRSLYSSRGEHPPDWLEQNFVPEKESGR
jgi:exonuclease VII small subunit